MTTLKQFIFNRTFIYLLLATSITAIGTPLVKWLIIHGGPFGISEPGAVSFCNLLFVGNICASALVLIIYKPSRIFQEIRTMAWSTFLHILSVSFISALSSMLFFIALTTLSVVDVVLVNRLDGVFYAIIAINIFHEKISISNWLSYSFIIVGIGIEIFLTSGSSSKTAYTIMIISTILYASKPVFNKIILKTMSEETMLFLIKLISAIFFFCIALYYYGPMHFRDIVKGDLWLAMTVYAFIIVLIGGILWYKGVKDASTLLLTNMKLLTPAISIVIAYFILSETPSLAEWISIGIVTIGASIGQIKLKRPETHLPKDSPLRTESIDRSLSAGG